MEARTESVSILRGPRYARPPQDDAVVCRPRAAACATAQYASARFRGRKAIAPYGYASKSSGISSIGLPCGVRSAARSQASR
jgi:hypothetical protein